MEPESERSRSNSRRTLVAAGAALLIGSIAVLRLASHDGIPVAREPLAAQPVAAQQPPVQVQPVPAATPTDAPDDRQALPDPVAQGPAPIGTVSQRATHLSEARGLFLSMAKENGIDCPPDLAVPEAVQDAVCSAYDAYLAAANEVQKVRQPIVSRILDEKLARGDAEHLANWSALKDPGEIADAKKALKAARQPTAAHQTVIVGGAGPRVDIIRVNERDDARLPPLYARFDRLRADYFAEMQRLLASAGITLHQR